MQIGPRVPSSVASTTDPGVGLTCGIIYVATLQALHHSPPMGLRARCLGERRGSPRRQVLGGLTSLYCDSVWLVDLLGLLGVAFGVRSWSIQRCYHAFRTSSMLRYHRSANGRSDTWSSHAVRRKAGLLLLREPRITSSLTPRTTTVVSVLRPSGPRGRFVQCIIRCSNSPVGAGVEPGQVSSELEQEWSQDKYPASARGVPAIWARTGPWNTPGRHPFGRPKCGACCIAVVMVL